MSNPFKDYLEDRAEAETLRRTQEENLRIVCEMTGKTEHAILAEGLRSWMIKLKLIKVPTQKR